MPTNASGQLHTLLGVVALIAGAAIFLRRKGTRSHKAIGRVYVASMLSLNVTALMLYHLTGRFGPFHVGAIVSGLTVVAGMVPALTRAPKHSWRFFHATFLSWSYVGLLSAFAAEVATRVPGFHFGTAVMVSTLVVTITGAVLIHTRVRPV